MEQETVLELFDRYADMVYRIALSYLRSCLLYTSSPTPLTPPANTVPVSVQRGKQSTQPCTAFSVPSKAVSYTHLAFFQQPFHVRPAAAAAVQHPGVRRGIQKLKSPPCHGAVPDIHHSDHELPAKAFGLAGVFKERHLTPPFSHTRHRSAGTRLSAQRFSAPPSRSAAGSARCV